VRDRIEAAFASWGHLAYRRAGLVIAAVLLVVAALVSQLPRFSFDTSTEGFFHEDDPVRIAYDAFREQFGRDTLILVAIRPRDVFDPDVLEKLRSLHEAIEREVPRLVEVTSLINARETRGVGDELVVGELFEDWPESDEALAELKRRALSNPLYLNHLISEDGRLTTIVIETEAYSSQGTQPEELTGFDEWDESTPAQREAPAFLSGEENAEIIEALLRVTEGYEAPDFEIYVSGAPVLVEELHKAMTRDTRRFTRSPC
jgi:predicted RND superfamily exporter protein